MSGIWVMTRVIIEIPFKKNSMGVCCGIAHSKPNVTKRNGIPFFFFLQWFKIVFLFCEITVLKRNSEHFSNGMNQIFHLFSVIRIIFS